MTGESLCGCLRESEGVLEVDERIKEVVQMMQLEMKARKMPMRIKTV